MNDDKPEAPVSDKEEEQKKKKTIEELIAMLPGNMLKPKRSQK